MNAQTHNPTTIDLRLDRIGISPPPPMKRVLIIDSSETDSFMLSQVLQVMGHSAEVVASVQQAKVRLRGYAPHFVICGQPASEMDQLLLTVNSGGEHESACVLVSLSEAVTTMNGRPTIPAGFHRQLTKPIDILQVQELMDDYRVDILPNDCDSR